MRNTLELGSWNVVCDRCGFKYKNYQLRKEWTGLMVCSECAEPRHPQTLIQVPEDNEAPPWSRPEPTDLFRATVEAIQTETAGPFGNLFPESSVDLPLFTEGT